MGSGLAVIFCGRLREFSLPVLVTMDGSPTGDALFGGNNSHVPDIGRLPRLAKTFVNNEVLGGIH